MDIALEASARDRTLDNIGIVCGTDKGSLVGDYLRHYEAQMAPWGDRAFTLLEIGVFDGASARMWSEYFPNAQIVGADITPDCARFAGGRIKIEIGSQSDPAFLHRLAASYDPLIVIDDGSHHADDQIITFERLFPALRPPGEARRRLDDLDALRQSSYGRQCVRGTCHRGLGTMRPVEAGSCRKPRIPRHEPGARRPIAGVCSDAGKCLGADTGRWGARSSERTAGQTAETP